LWILSVLLYISGENLGQFADFYSFWKNIDNLPLKYEQAENEKKYFPKSHCISLDNQVMWFCYHNNETYVVQSRTLFINLFPPTAA